MSSLFAHRLVKFEFFSSIVGVWYFAYAIPVVLNQWSWFLVYLKTWSLFGLGLILDSLKLLQHTKKKHLPKISNKFYTIIVFFFFFDQFLDVKEDSVQESPSCSSVGKGHGCVSESAWVRVSWGKKKKDQVQDVVIHLTSNSDKFSGQLLMILSLPKQAYH